MRRQLQVLDTSIVDELLEVPGKSAGDGVIAAEFEARRTEGAITFHLPAAAVFQVGAHVGHIPEGGLRRQAAQRLAALVRRTLDREAPWTFSPLLWDETLLTRLLEPSHAAILDLAESLARQHLEIGDLLVLGEFEQLRANLDASVVDVDVWTLDAALEATVQAIRTG